MLTIFAVSDSIGETAEQVAIATRSQFKGQINIKRIPYIKSLNEVEEFINSIDITQKIMIISTIITVNIREYLTKKCRENRINIVNILGPTINIASTILDTYPDYNPGAMWEIDRDYYKKIEAVEFAI